MTQLEQAVSSFYGHASMTTFMLDVINGNVTPFIEALSRENELTPHENARYLSQLAKSYIESSYQTLKYFGAGEGKTLSDFMHRNVNTPRRTVNYIITDLENKLSPQGFFNVMSVALEPHRNSQRVETSTLGSADIAPELIQKNAA